MAQRVYGFTLAEVLIALVIIGIIAALTIPNLMQKYTEQATVKKVQKFYSNLSNAYSLAMKENGPVSEWGLTGNNSESVKKIYQILFKPYFKIAKDCGTANTGNCITNSKYKHLSNSESTNFSAASNRYKFLLDDGGAVWIYSRSDVGIIYFAYDFNGQKEPNQIGKDTFEFVIKNEAVFPSGIATGKYAHESFNSYCLNSTTDNGFGHGSGCTAWVVYKGNMDYLHCTGLTWKSRSCKDK